jgi:membrane protein required for colicin V production
VNQVDLYILLGLIGNVSVGFAVGFIRQAAGVVGLVVGVYLGGRYYSNAADLLHPPGGGGLIADANWAKIIGFAAIVILCSIIAGVLAHFLHTIVYKVYLGTLDRAMGALVGALHSLLFAMALVVAATIFPVPALTDALKDSVIAKMLTPFVPVVLALLPPQFQDFLNQFKRG